MAIENENEKRETVADIVAQIRAAAYIQNADTPKSVLRFADRIEAAWKHEREEAEADALSVGGIVEAARTAEKSLAVGNSAAMLDALTEIRDTIMNGGFDERSPAHFVNICDAALAAPARNCDRFSDELDAQLAFLNEVWLISVDRETMLARDKYENWSDEMRTRYGKWLLAPAAERKGEN